MSAIPAGYKQTEVGVIPEDWTSTTVSSLAASVRNAIVGGPFGSDLVSRDYVDDGVPVIRGQNMGRRWLEGPYVYVTEKKASFLEANLARPGDVLFTQRGTLGQVSLAPDTPHRRYLVSQSQMKVTLNREIADPNFFHCWFVSNGGQESIRLNTIQTGVPHINLGILRSLSVPLPPISEQEAIAEAVSDADALIESLEQLLTKKRHLKQAAMQELLTGKKRLPGFSGEWEEKRLLSLVTIAQGQVDPKDFPYCSMALVGPEHVESGTGKLLARRTALEQGAISGKYLFKAGDVVYGKINPYLRKAFLADFDGLCSADMYPLRPVEGVAPGFLLAVILGSEFSKYSESVSARSGMPKINRDELAGFAIKIPLAFDEQTAIAAVLLDMNAEIAELEAQLAKTRAIKQGMMQKLLTGEIRLI